MTSTLAIMLENPRWKLQKRVGALLISDTVVLLFRLSRYEKSQWRCRRNTKGVAQSVLVDRRVSNANPAPTHAGITNNHATPQPRVNRPAQSASDDFFSRFTRNANIVASGVAKNVRKVGNQIKESVDDIMYPYRRRPK
ncbi:hypothetical protein HanHA300_Chr07g0241941 [Helianthus annuus]|nr:hypothetical protein HanHA300_Chr07g0241941 [Helianthus annuus]